MPIVDCVVETKISQSPRARQVEALFDVPPREKSRIEWKGSVPIDDPGHDWSVGLIVGPSGCGKSTLARKLFPDNYHPEMSWGAPSVLDDCAESLSVSDIADSFSSVGFGTIPAWLRPYRVLSTGERFRAEVARRIMELESPVVVDEFTSVVDRQVAKASSHAAQKYVRKLGKQFVAVTCHEDVLDWLQPDWVLRPATMTFTWRSLQRRPRIEVALCRVQRGLWRLFSPFHYLTKKIHPATKCFCLFVEDQPVTFCGVLHFCHKNPMASRIRRGSRIVTLPDWQGLGFATLIADTIGAAYTALGFFYRVYPAHPSFIRAYDRSPKWVLRKKPGTYHPRTRLHNMTNFGGRPAATFEYVGPKMKDLELARRLCLG